MSQISKLLTDEIVQHAEAGLKKLGKYGTIAFKLRMIIAAKKHSISTVCEIHDISRTSLTKWIKQLQSGKFSDLVNKPKKPRSVLTYYIDTIKEWIKEDSNIIAKDLVIRIKEQFGIKTRHC